ncbi:MAG: phage portal protein [Ketobacter sp.]|nr:phage portal protein [Ketobacter sp.]
MNIFTRFGQWISGNSTGQRKGQQNPAPGTSAHNDTPIVTVDGALQVSTVWACVMLLVDTISSLPLMVYSTDSEGNRTVDKSSRLYTVLHSSPNQRQTSQEFWGQMLLNYFMRGNAYARIKRDGRGEVISLWPLSADQINVLVADDGSLIYVYSYETEQLIYTEKDILHIKAPGNGVVGMSRLDYMRSTVGLAINTQNHMNKTFNTNARRPGILMSDVVLNPEQREALKANFGDIVSGKDKELYILEAQFKFEPLGMSPADLQLLETRQYSVQDLARWFGVPSVLINDTGETTSLGSSVKEIIDGFHRLTLRPQLENIEQSVIKRVLSPAQKGRNVTVEFNLDALLRASLGDRMDIYAKGVQNGLYNRNEPRRSEGLPAYDAGEIFTAQSNLYPVDKLGTQQSNGDTQDVIKQ